MNNGFSLMESILALLIVSICIQILIGCICSISNQEERILNEKIEKKWFYSD
ncbi:MAG: prepilin-type N-terminal cleavage/methylation domain-containing protein [Floccifex porci]|uniref:Prepilin-type N-terminal cleavage/methylation domain-containing protein n=1 Tax=Floccifex porci TaxID=2606629 RepID=A0A7X2N1A9_9FIRM|nr:prepilin-type N-terminal cleavage/methylation domain-containing protein [Floccifex porci]MCI7801898.1 prepilin-type N-terminal cleavage/methylation domain-containing protein [Erysipelotrichaceae bacterium]MDD7467267.1 prepilin-type N-terminal cleavage/methylation domain-containing protein [Floccifex porci]MDO4480837.1 prepilin-type N-terminal cleavage/methylation domain-containing protein [Erysipelotrichaceae bacterium]MDY4797040.1 prepilin-type N-terminal cleavage/methylation domain-contain